ncbi:MAG: methylated-DNA--[protein]-cysteine S-methyltransferase [Thermoanaerobaculia bacterium]|nr:methylated-DNA--[protein]-cysteine S-methyltransferase [Thermoanaerobaculia bacterium]
MEAPAHASDGSPASQPLRVGLDAFGTDHRPRELEAAQRRFGRVALAPEHPLLERLHSQLGEFFAGRRRELDLPLDLAGTAFELEVWHELVRIPYGETRSYEDVALAIGQPGAQRAVGLANGRNPVAIVVPCHRVINKNGKLGGFGGGLARKRFLLALEQRHSGLFDPRFLGG